MARTQRPFRVQGTVHIVEHITRTRPPAKRKERKEKLTSNGSRVRYSSSIPTPSTVLLHSWQSANIFLESSKLNFRACKNRLCHSIKITVDRRDQIRRCGLETFSKDKIKVSSPLTWEYHRQSRSYLHHVESLPRSEYSGIGLRCRVRPGQVRAAWQVIRIRSKWWWCSGINTSFYLNIVTQVNPSLYLRNLGGRE